MNVPPRAKFHSIPLSSTEKLGGGINGGVGKFSNKWGVGIIGRVGNIWKFNKWGLGIIGLIAIFISLA